MRSRQTLAFRLVATGICFLVVALASIALTLWSAGFGLYALRYWPVLSRPRLDGKAG